MSDFHVLFQLANALDKFNSNDKCVGLELIYLLAFLESIHKHTLVWVVDVSILDLKEIQSYAVAALPFIRKNTCNRSNESTKSYEHFTKTSLF
jgi:hypothetical protein